MNKLWLKFGFLPLSQLIKINVSSTLVQDRKVGARLSLVTLKKGGGVGWFTKCSQRGDQYCYWLIFIFFWCDITGWQILLVFFFQVLRLCQTVPISQKILERVKPWVLLESLCTVSSSEWHIPNISLSTKSRSIKTVSNIPSCFLFLFWVCDNGKMEGQVLNHDR